MQLTAARFWLLSSLAYLSSAQLLRISEFPPCAQKCITSALATAHCTGMYDLPCVCQGAAFNKAVGACELHCSKPDLRKTVVLSEELCAPLGGLDPPAKAILSSIFPSDFPTPTTSLTWPAPTGGATGYPGYYPTGTGTATGYPGSYPSGTPNVPPAYTGAAVRPWAGGVPWTEGLLALAVLAV